MDTAQARRRLDDMLADLDRSIAILKGESPEPGESHYDQDRADSAANISDGDRTEAASRAMEKQRSGVLAALARLDEGRYGLCVDCGNPIPEGRLEALPDAARCVSCQAKYDRSQR